jgi:hypothetical protein
MERSASVEEPMPRFHGCGPPRVDAARDLVASTAALRPIVSTGCARSHPMVRTVTSPARGRRSGIGSRSTPDGCSDGDTMVVARIQPLPDRSWEGAFRCSSPGVLSVGEQSADRARDGAWRRASDDVDGAVAASPPGCRFESSIEPG